MIHHISEISRSTTSETDILEITSDVQARVDASGVRDGLCVVHVAGSTASISTIEFESGAVADLKRALEKLAPMNAEYEHNLRWGDGNGYSHVRAALMGPSRVFPVHGGELSLGTWQQIILLDFDNRPRQRQISVHVQGVGA